MFSLSYYFPSFLLFSLHLFIFLCDRVDLPQHNPAYRLRRIDAFFPLDELQHGIDLSGDCRRRQPEEIRDRGHLHIEPKREFEKRHKLSLGHFPVATPSDASRGGHTQ